MRRPDSVFSKRVKTRNLSSDQFLDSLLQLIKAYPKGYVPSVDEDIHGELFLTVEAFSKFIILSSNKDISVIFKPDVNPKDGISGVFILDNMKIQVRTNAFQKSSERDYENLGSHDMEFRIYKH